MAVPTYTPTTGAGTAANTTGVFPGSSALDTITTFSGLSKADLNMPVNVSLPASAEPGGPLAAPTQTGTSRVTVGQALTAYLSMSPADQQNIANRLWQAGYFDSTLYKYVQDMGRPPTIRPVDIEAAYARALRDAAHSGQSFDDWLSQESQVAQQTLGNIGPLPNMAGTSGPGAGRVGIHGGGQKFVIDLANPDDVAWVANQVAQSGLHRNFSDAELNQIVAHMQSQEFADASAKNLSAEAQSWQDFLARQESRDIYQSAQGITPTDQTAGTPGPSGAGGGAMAALPQQYAQTLQQLSAQGQLSGLDPNILAAVAMAESSGRGGAVNSAGYGGFFGLAPDRNYPGGSVSHGQMVGTDAQSFAAQATVAASEFASLLQQAKGNVLLAETMYQEGPGGPNASKGVAAGEGVGVFKRYGVGGTAQGTVQYAQPGADSPNDVYVPSQTTVLTPTADASASAYAFMRSQDATEYRQNQYSDQAANMAKALASLGQRSPAAPGPATGA